MYKELEKYKTNNEFIEKGLTFQEYKADYGTLLNDFIEHKNKWFWERKYYHNHLSELYIKMLNNITIQHYFQK